MPPRKLVAVIDNEISHEVFAYSCSVITKVDWKICLNDVAVPGIKTRMTSWW
jgi:hypothetical protein